MSKKEEERKEAESWREFNTMEHPHSADDGLTEQQNKTGCGKGKCVICTCPNSAITVDNNGMERL